MSTQSKITHSTHVAPSTMSLFLSPLSGSRWWMVFQISSSESISLSLVLFCLAFRAIPTYLPTYLPVLLRCCRRLPQKTRSGCREAAVDRVCGACRIAGIIGQQIGHKARNIFRRAVPTEWNRLRKRLFATGEYLFGEFEGHASGDGARTAGIDPDSTRSLLQRGRLGQADDGVFGGHIGADSRAAHQAQSARHIDNRPAFAHPR